MPDDWRVTVKINDSGDDNILIRGSHVQSVDGLFYNTDGFSNNAAGDHALESAVAKSVGEPALVPGSR